MLILRPGSNYGVFTLSEKFNFYNPSVSTYELYYILKVTNMLNEQSINILLGPDVSTNQDRYNKFSITVIQGINSNPIDAEIGLYGLNDDNGSQWEYEVWACDGPSPTQSVVIDFGTTYSYPRPLEVGKMIYTYQYGKPAYQPER